MKVLAELVNTPVVVPQEGLSGDSNHGKIRYGSDVDLPDVSDEWFQSASVNTGYKMKHKMKHIIKAAVTRLEKATNNATEVTRLKKRIALFQDFLMKYKEWDASGKEDKKLTDLKQLLAEDKAKLAALQ